MARSEHGIPILPEHLDCDPWLLNCANGTIDLKAGTLREHQQNDLITKLCPAGYDPDAQAPHFQEFLTGIFNNDPQLIAYVRRLLGYCLTGDVREQILPIFWGSGANGKSTLINAVADTLGDDYMMKANRDLFLAKKSDSHPAQMARLFGNTNRALSWKRFCKLAQVASRTVVASRPLVVNSRRAISC